MFGNSTKPPKPSQNPFHTSETVDVFTCGAINPKCALYTVGEVISGYNRPGKRITPDMRPTELLAYVSGMAQAINGNQNL